MRVFVTGGSGFIGSHLIETLLARGWSVRALAHRSRLPQEDKIEIIRGDIGDIELLRKGLRGTDIAFHLTAALGSSVIGAAEFRRINALGTETVLEAARLENVRRVVHFSSAGIFGALRQDEIADESHSPNPVSIYDRTKLEGETAALGFAGKGMDVVVVRPGWAYGPRDRRTFKLIKAICAGRFLMAGRGAGRQTPIYIDDLTRGVLLAAEKGKKGQIYHLAAGEILLAREIVEAVAEACGRKIPRLGLPLFLARPAAFVLEKSFVPLRREPPFNRAKLSFFVHSRALSAEKAKRQLGFAPEVDFRQGIAKALDWYRKNGWL
ncbi:MAG: NAD-dependent epimerase/dehydratase family protein [Acidobacteriota bacterium]